MSARIVPPNERSRIIIIINIILRYVYIALAVVALNPEAAHARDNQRRWNAFNRVL
jgi:hypothetical protein